MFRKKSFTVIIAICMLLITTVNAYAFSLTGISEDNSSVQALGVDTEKDKQYLKSIVDTYRDRYVVTEESYIDCSSIDDFFRELSQPISLEEIDSGTVQLDLSRMGDKSYQEFLKAFKVLGGMSGYSAEFEPTAYYNIYRDVSLVGGYIKYSRTHSEVYPSYWEYICNLENMTKEVVPYDTRIMLLNKIQNLSYKMDNDKSYKVFVLKNGKVDSMFECKGGEW